MIEEPKNYREHPVTYEHLAALMGIVLILFIVGVFIKFAVWDRAYEAGQYDNSVMEASSVIDFAKKCNEENTITFAAGGDTAVSIPCSAFIKITIPH